LMMGGLLFSKEVTIKDRSERTRAKRRALKEFRVGGVSSAGRRQMCRVVVVWWNQKPNTEEGLI
jgi:hypothetical protein